jgi:hypothetical protein
MKTVFLFLIVAITAAHAASITITIHYIDPTVPDGFEVQRATPAAAPAFSTVTTLPGDGRVFVDTGLPDNTHYSYRVRAVFNRPDGTKYGTWSNVTTAVSAPDPVAPATGLMRIEAKPGNGT